MKLSIRLKPSSSKNCIGKISPDGALTVSVRARPVENAANEALIELLSDALHTPKSSIQIIKGHTSKSKIIDLNNVNNIPEDIYGKCF